MALLAGKNVLITGALGTIGQALVTRYSEEGANVVALDRPESPGAQETVSKLSPNARYFGCDLGDLPGTEAAVSKLAEDVGGIDVLVNNAAHVHNRPFEDFSIDEYEEEVRINSSAAFVLTRVASRHMKQQKYGKIVNLTSMTLTGHWDGFVPYIASKGAMFGLIKGFARELGPFGINVNGISPGAVVSDAEYRHYGDRREQYHQWILERQSVKRRIEPMDIANLAVFLSSAHADLISGQNIQVDAGW
ncbi:SDR family oxidoreductase [Rhizobium ruizarguesonis]|uniref:SDR family oxidoreductase n=1 Tax=Rhizobium TaxID=379 RepID=UPI0013C10B70|nr:SDR family oxidoreductase [Rhizobium ruizarguesonis]MBY5828518.1 SDR family oxidoreductase [Rhizobium leguminosarum]MBY5856255.1 SDR family oxidoreductase [Rhizobium leguminosarum]NEI96596.1 SDR family oxidoreductase [Rhizobium ruizarguesonis]NEJ33781.1 SDR family oxidoreductase [Rhizobium ruizarguesonis]